MRNPYDFDDETMPKRSTNPGPFKRPGKRLQSGDDSVRETNDDAAISRLSCVKCGYIDDPYIELLVNPLKYQRRSPLINRGSFIRFEIINKIMFHFVRMNAEKSQIISLGSGFDTRYFLLRDQQLNPGRYFEIDFPEIVSEKISLLRGKSQLLRHFETECVSTERELHCGPYHILPGDLRQWSTVLDSIFQHGFDCNLPTMILSECVLIYLKPEDSQRIVDWAGKTINRAIFLTYEQILPHDNFGRMMINNLRMRGLELPGYVEYPDLQTQRFRYKSAGWEECEAEDMINLYDKNISDEEKSRIAKLEMLDELEEWTTLAKHYCFVLAKKGIDMSL